MHHDVPCATSLAVSNNIATKDKAPASLLGSKQKFFENIEIQLHMLAITALNEGIPSLHPLGVLGPSQSLN